jgi:hypothetical protein
MAAPDCLIYTLSMWSFAGSTDAATLTTNRCILRSIEDRRVVRQHDCLYVGHVLHPICGR